eukprot:12238483-Alexandrium_andersonii.AAC.1
MQETPAAGQPETRLLHKQNIKRLAPRLRAATAPLPARARGSRPSSGTTTCTVDCQRQAKGARRAH